VLHGCRQSVSWEVRLTPLTDEIPIVNLYLTIYSIDIILFGAKTSRYGPYELGYRRATKTFTKWCKTVPALYGLILFYLINFIFKMENKEELIIKKSYNFKLKTDCHLQFGDMKKEFRVIVDH